MADLQNIVLDAAALRLFLSQEFPQVADQFTLGEITPEGLVLSLNPGPDHLRPGGTISGPAMFALADVAVYLAILSRIGPVSLSVTTSATMDFMRRPAAGKPISARVRLLKIGRSLAVADALLYAAGEADPVARASMTYAIPPVR